MDGEDDSDDGVCAMVVVTATTWSGSEEMAYT